MGQKKLKSEGRVCVVDDDRFIRATLKKALTSVGFAVELYETPLDFITRYTPGSNVCLILDLRMPGHSGLWLQEELLRKGIDLPIIVYTGNADVPVAVKVMAEGAYTLLEKPISNEILIENVRSALRHHQKMQQRRFEVDAAVALMQSLTSREQQVSTLLCQGLTAPAIAEVLGLSARTIEAHRVRIFAKLGIKSTPELARLNTLANLVDCDTREIRAAIAP